MPARSARRIFHICQSNHINSCFRRLDRHFYRHRIPPRYRVDQQNIAFPQMIFKQQHPSYTRNALKPARHGNGFRVQHKSRKKNRIDNCQPARSVKHLFRKDSRMGTAKNKNIVFSFDCLCNLFRGRGNFLLLAVPRSGNR